MEHKSATQRYLTRVAGARFKKNKKQDGAFGIIYLVNKIKNRDAMYTVLQIEL